jgi:hypothetical protein
MRYVPKIDDLVWVSDGRLVSFRVLSVNRDSKTATLMTAYSSLQVLRDVPWSRLHPLNEFED